MAEPTRPDPSHKKLTRSRSKNFDPDPSLVLWPCLKLCSNAAKIHQFIHNCKTNIFPRVIMMNYYGQDFTHQTPNVS